ncbi:MAG: RNA methyltransferase [Planctomycetia bacterium]|nr:RNA methyltransferase [Planctomycetia bacterium]
MMTIPIALDDLADSRLDAFRNLPERTLRGESLFIAEGELVADRLLRSGYPIESVLVARDVPQAMAVLPAVPENVPVYSLPAKVMLSEIVGFPYYHGVLVLARRPELRQFGDLFGLGLRGDEGSEPDYSSVAGAWVVLPDATKPDNLGLVFRSAAALGARGVVLGEKCCDPFSRRALRVSMGGVLQVPICVSRDLAGDLKELRLRRTRREDAPVLFATVLAEDAVRSTTKESYPACSLLLFGNEYTGLTPELVAICDEKIMIPIRPDVDSLNLGVSAGIFLYEYKRLARESESRPGKLG